MMMRSCCVVLLVAGTTFAQSQADRDWPMFNRDLASTRYSPLKQIDASNVSKLTKAWQYRFNREGKTITGLSASELYQEITPIVVNGIMYSPSGDRSSRSEPKPGKSCGATKCLTRVWHPFAAFPSGRATAIIRRASSSPPVTR
jgi:quinoprotein glucose dehydrogenase